MSIIVGGPVEEAAVWESFSEALNWLDTFVREDFPSALVRDITKESVTETEADKFKREEYELIFGTPELVAIELVPNSDSWYSETDLRRAVDAAERRANDAAEGLAK